jgi:hypothetical protein
VTPLRREVLPPCERLEATPRPVQMPVPGPGVSRDGSGGVVGEILFMSVVCGLVLTVIRLFVEALAS